MIVHHSAGLHEGVAYRGTTKAESDFFESFRHRVGLRGSYPADTPGRRGFRGELPDPRREIDTRVFQGHIGFGIFDDGCHLESVPDDSRIQDGCIDSGIRPSFEDFRPEPLIDLPHADPPFEDRYPGESRLLSFETEEFEEFT